MKREAFILIFTFISVSLFAQINNIGSPVIINYTRSDYKAANQNWSIQQAYNGMMYFANNEGLLEYDGTFWNLYPLPNNSVLRSVKNGPETRMYAGGFNEIGYYEIGESGGAHYYSLTDLLKKEDKDFEEVWKIYQHSDGIIFQSYMQIMIYKNDQINVIKAPSLFHFSFLVNNEYYVNDMKEGLMRFALGKLHPLMGTEALRGKEIWGMQSYRDQIMLATASKGLFLYNGNNLCSISSPANSFLKKNQIYSMLRLSNNDYVFGTIQDGCLFTNNSLEPGKVVNMSDGLQNNTILCMEEDLDGNLWLGTDHGIDYVKLNSSIRLLGESYGLSGGYTANIHNGILYLGTNQGLFCKRVNDLNEIFNSEKQFKLIENSKGQVWSLNTIDNTLFCGHNNGTFIIKGSEAHKTCDITGGWICLQIPDDPEKIIGGTYTGLILFKKQNNNWRFIKSYKGFTESARKMAFDKDGSLWMVHGYKGAYHIFFDSSYDSILSYDFYPSDNHGLNGQVIDIAKSDDRLLFICTEGFYTFDKIRNQFSPDKKFNDIFRNKKIREITIDKNDDLWYFTQDKIGVMRVREDGYYNDIYLPFHDLNNRIISGFEFVLPQTSGDAFIGTENGFAYYKPETSKPVNDSLKVYLKFMITGNSDRSIYFRNDSSSINPTINYSNNNIEFIFSSNNYVSPSDTKYSSFLKGHDKSWTNWELKNTREFTNLFEGDYTFMIRAMDSKGKISSIQQMSFKVSPPFLRSRTALVIYALILLVLIFVIVFLVRRRIERIKIRNTREQEKLFKNREEKLQLEALEAEKEIIRMKNEKLSLQMKQKNKELANSTMLMLQKNEVLIKLKQELKKMKSTSDNPHELRMLLKKIDSEIDSEKQWKVFETSFENVHEEFLKRIKVEYPDLTPRELKLCAYLRMNISSKEISVLMNISTRGVEISRYRLRKKLKLKREDNLTDFIISF